MGWLEEAGEGSTQEIMEQLRTRLLAALMIFPVAPVSVEEGEDGELGIMDGKGTAVIFTLVDTGDGGIQLRYGAPVCEAPARNQRNVYRMFLEMLEGRCFVRFQLRGGIISLEGALPAHALTDTTVFHAAGEAFLFAKSTMQFLVQHHGLRPWHGDESDPQYAMRDFWSVPLPMSPDGAHPVEKERTEALGAMLRGRAFSRMRLATTLIAHLKWMDTADDDEDGTARDRTVTFRPGDIRELLDATHGMDPGLRASLEAALASGETIECDLNELNDGRVDFDRIIERCMVREGDGAGEDGVTPDTIPTLGRGDIQELLDNDPDMDPDVRAYLEDALASGEYDECGPAEGDGTPIDPNHLFEEDDGMEGGGQDFGEAVGGDNDDWDDDDLPPPLGGDPRIEKALILQLSALLRDLEQFHDFTAFRQSRRTFVLRHDGFALLTTFLPGPRGTASLMCHAEICALTGPPTEALLRALLDAAYYPLPVKVCLQETTVGVCGHLSIRHLTDETARHLLLSAFELAEKLHDELTLLHGLKSLRNPGYPADPEDNEPGNPPEED